MLIGFVRGLTRIRVTVAYALILVGVTTALAVLGPRISDRVISHASTNLHNLSHGHLGTLFVSAFVIDAGPIYAWLPGLICLLAIVELLWGSARLLLAFVVGHVGATLLVAVVRADLMPRASARAAKASAAASRTPGASIVSSPSLERTTLQRAYR